MNYKSLYSKIARLTAIALLAGVATACGDEAIDNSYSRSNAVIQLETSADYVVLDENNPDAVALTVKWDPAHPYGNEYITTYEYQVEVAGSKASACKEYEDDGVFTRQYTNAELQALLIDHFGCLTSSLATLNFSVTASFEGPRVVIPDIATASVKVKTYGAKQYMADQLFMSGSAVGDDIELFTTSGIYTWTGMLQGGKINFPVIYGDENNAISPASADVAITDDDMPAVMVDAAKANYWVVPQADNYRITINMTNQTVKIVPAGSVVEIDHLFMSGAATGGADIEIMPALEADGLYAWRGELKAGKLMMPIEFNGETAVTIVPKNKSSHDINDGQAHEFDQVAGGNQSAYWEIPADGTYRIVVNTDDHTVIIYSPATDLKNTVVSYNNTVDQINPYSQEVTELWMWGGFNASAHDDGLKAGFQAKYKLIQSLANPNVFVYHGDPLPRSTSTDDWSKATGVGALNFLVSSIENNVYAFGSTVDAKRNSHRGYLPVTLGQEMTLVPGQSDNRYAYFCVPENCTYVVVDIEKLTVTFANK